MIILVVAPKTQEDTGKCPVTSVSVWATSCPLLVHFDDLFNFLADHHTWHAQVIPAQMAGLQ